MKTMHFLFISFFCMLGVASRKRGDTFEICLKDEVGEMVHLEVRSSGLVVGYSEFDFEQGEGLVITGTAFGSFKTLAYPKVMIGADINNDCTKGLLPGKFNVILDVETLTGPATGVLFPCNPTGDREVIPFEGAIAPCSDDPAANNGHLFFDDD